VLVSVGGDPSVSAAPQVAQHQIFHGNYVCLPLAGASYFAAQTTPGGGLGAVLVAVGTLAPQVDAEDALAALCAQNGPGTRWYRNVPPYSDPAS
jgi:hypothetical protein